MDPDSSIWIQGLLFIFFLLAGSFFSLAEASIREFSESKWKRLGEENKRSYKRLAKRSDNPARMLSTAQIGRVLSCCALLLTAEGGVFSYWRRTQGQLSQGFWQALILMAAVAGLLFLILAVFLPQKVAEYIPERTMRLTAPLFSVLLILMVPITFLCNLCAEGAYRFLGVGRRQGEETVTEEEILDIVDDAEESGAIEHSEKDMINNILEFDDRTVDEIMTHRTEMTALEVTAGLEEVLETIQTTGYSRIPVYEETADNLVGILYVKDLFSLINSKKEFRLREYLREPFYVPESTRCTELFQEFKKKKLHMAVVVDEYGGTDGIVTMEDLLESIVGNIQDEYDDEEEEIRRISDTSYVFDGRTSMEEVEHTLDTELSSEEDYDTIGGLIVSLLGGIPEEVDHPEVQIGPWKFRVLEVEENRISKIQAERMEVPEEEKE